MSSEITRLLELAAAVAPHRRTRILEEHCADPTLREEVETLLRYGDEAELCFDRAIQGVAASLENAGREPSPGDLIGSYRVVRLIGRGGMGSVYRAERADGEVQQTVALKLLRADACRTGWRERFLNERQLLATLQHPSIVRLLDAGHTRDSRPYLVMELVEGVAIDRYAAEIDVRERLRLFLRVCEGVAHAHRRLIIHRDLKPSNIVVNTMGEPKVLDFGIATLLSDPSNAPHMGERLLTPDYASPEQLRGEPQTTATDVYSLGAVLYRMLTGVASRQSARSMESGRPTAPSRLNPRLPRDIDFVVAKALADEPELRYGSVDDFAMDVRAVLGRRPVQARSGDAWYRVRSRLRQYWAPLIVALLVIASLSCGLWIANRQRRVAERRFMEVRQLANKLFNIDAQVAQLQGSSKTRRLIVDTALEYLNRISVDVRMQPDLALELATAHMRVARVQGVNISPNLGLTKEAEVTAEKAQQLIDEVLRETPNNRIARLRAGQIAHDRMILAGDSHRDGEAIRFAHTAIEHLDRYLDAGTPGDRDEAQQAIIALMNVANRFVLAGEFDQGIGIACRAISLAQATGWPAQAGAALMVVAFAQRGRGNLDEALEAIRESVRLLEPEPSDHRPGRVQPYSLALMREGQILGEPEGISMGRSTEALEALERSLKISEDFARRDAGDFQSQYRVFNAETKIAAIVREREPARALQLYDDALRRLDGVASHGGTIRNEATTLAESTYPLLRLGRRQEARKRLDTAFDLLSKMGEYPAAQVEPGSAAQEALRALAAVEAQEGDLTRAASVYRDLIRMLNASVPSSKVSLEDAVEFSCVLNDAARLLARAGRRDEAAALDARRAQLWRDQDAKLPNNAFVRRQLERTRN